MLKAERPGKQVFFAPWGSKVVATLAPYTGDECTRPFIVALVHRHCARKPASFVGRKRRFASLTPFFRELGPCLALKASYAATKRSLLTVLMPSSWGDTTCVKLQAHT